MNTWVTVTGADADLAPWFETVEANLSRFRPDSPLSQLNRMPERWVVVPPLLFDALTQALAAAEATGGAYDPTILSALEASGYSRSFDVGASPVAPSQPAGRWPQVKLDHALNAVWLPGGVRIDLGGIGKGFAVDGGLDRLTGAPRALINAGGDLAVRTAPDDGPVLIAVADPWDHWQTIASFGVCRGAVATSSTLGRRWGDGLHHIIDPRTGRPTASGVVAATVVSGSAVQADVLAKACIVLGAEPALTLLRTYQSEAFWLPRNLASGTPIGQLFWPWLLSRGSGIVAYVLLWASICIGLLQSSGMLKGISLPAANVDVHDFLSVAALHMTLFHALILTWDSYVTLHLKDVLVPFASSYKSFPMAIGVIAFYLCLIATVTTYLRAYMKPAAWRVIHQVTSFGFALALLHGILIGTDGNLPPIVFLYFFTGGTAALLLLYRIYLAGNRRPLNGPVD